MSRNTACLMDAGCLQASSSNQSLGTCTNENTRSFVQTINLWFERSKQRRELLALAADISLLDDLGLSLYDIKREARKHFWNE